MIPYPYKFVDFGGIDLSEINGKVVEGIHDRIITALNRCGEVVLYNWSFAGIPIAPSYCSIEVRYESLIVNEVIEIREDDTVWVESLIPPEPEPPVLVPLAVTENGQFSPQDYDADGFSAVSVEVPIVQPKYVEVEPDFYGLTYSYLTLQGTFRDGINRQQCYFLATTEANAKYIVFLPEITSTRYRVGLWEDKSYSDFAPYLEVAGDPYIDIYSGASVITGSTELSGDGLTRRFFFTGSGGEVLIGTSNVSALVKPILLKIQEE